MPHERPASCVPWLAAGDVDGRLTAQLAAFHARWETRAAAFRRWAPPPWWAPGLVLDAAIRDAYERHLPVQAFLDELRGLGETLLPTPAWLPDPLRPRHGAAGSPPATAPPASLPDLWQDLPPALAGRVTFPAAELPALLCALADPSRFGTDFGRYPAQLAALAAAAGRRAPGRSLRLLDLGCGTGQGTCELAAALARTQPGAPLTATGLTREPLEAWMADARRLPHAPERERRHAAFALPANARTFFVAGDVLAPPLRGTFDIVVANGLIGGSFLRTPHALARFFDGLRSLLAADGIASFANRFHAGDLRHVQAAMTTAAAAGWTVAGAPPLWFASRRA
jgi:SAM-dependent methyltransferase